MEIKVEWVGEQHMLDRHPYMTVDIANEVLTDPDALMFNPDPRSKSGKSVRVIGYSYTLSDVCAVLVLPHDDDGSWYGLTGHKANDREKRLYKEAIDTSEGGEN